MKKLLLAAIAIPAVALGSRAIAAEAAESPHTFTANVGLVSDYRFRGISQSYSDPAIQGGFDYSHSSGVYLGTWGSSVSGNQYLGGNGMEWDLYGGYRHALGPVNLDVGLLYYYYASARLPTANPPGSTEKYDTVEAAIAASWKWLTLKYSYALTDFFGVQQSTYGNGGSDGSGYLDLSASYPLADKLTAVAHIGHQSVSNYGDLDYTDWKLGLTYDLHGFVLGAAWVDTNADDTLYSVTGAKGTRSLGDGTAVVSVNRSF
jgi:uncharacterized protein (TIGR02001 family)